MHRRTTTASALLAAVLSATALATADAAHAGSPAVPGSDRAGAYRVTAEVNKTSVLVDSVVKVKGTVKPAAPGSTVRLQLRYADQKGWKTVDTAKLSANSRYKFKDEVTSVRARSYRVVKPAAGGHPSGKAKTGEVTVYGWRPLTSLSPALATAMGEVGSVSINGTAYPDSLVTFGTPTTASIDYNLNRGCTQLRGRFGVADTSPAAGTASFALLADGATEFAGTFGLTQSQDVTTDVTGVFRISVNAALTGGGIAAVGSPQVLCSF